MPLTGILEIPRVVRNMPVKLHRLGRNHQTQPRIKLHFSHVFAAFGVVADQMVIQVDAQGECFDAEFELVDDGLQVLVDCFRLGQACGQDFGFLVLVF